MCGTASTIAQFIFFDSGGFVCFGAVFVLIFMTGLLGRARNHCPRCEEINRPEANFCAQCGQRLIDD